MYLTWSKSGKMLVKPKWKAALIALVVLVVVVVVVVVLG